MKEVTVMPENDLAPSILPDSDIAEKTDATLSETDNAFLKRLRDIDCQDPSCEPRIFAHSLYALLENIDDYILFSDRNAKPVYFNQNYARIMEDLLGIKMEPGLQPHTFLPEKERSWWEGLHKRVLKGEKVSATYVHSDEDGKKRYFEVSFNPVLSEGKIEGFSEFTRDITKRKMTEKALEKAHGKMENQNKALRALLNAPPDLVFLFDTEGNIISANQKVADLLGLEIEKIEGKNILEIAPEPIAKKRMALLKQLVRKRTRLEVEDEGTLGRIYNLRGFPISDEKGTVLQVAVYGEDITEKKLMEKTIRDKERELKKKNKRLEQANIALEVLLRKRQKDREVIERNVLTNIQELIEPFVAKLRETDVTETRDTYLEIIESNLKEVVSPFLRTISQRYETLTPTEITVANLVRQGMPTKRIAEVMSLSARTIEFHRNGIRNKLGIKKKSINLRSYLLSMK